jgi:trehalose 6-phosphate phosphatase
MPSYLLQSHQLEAFARFVTPDTLFAFDLDGTLTQIVEERSGAVVAEPVRDALKRLAGLAQVAVITGRSRRDAQTLLGFQPHLLIGNQGAEWPGDDERNRHFTELCLKWRERLDEALFHHGVEVEFKGESISLHYRKAAEPEAALSRIHAVIDALEPPPRLIGGKSVVNVVPREAPDKGDALVAAMERLGCSKAIYFGDDETDEDVFRLKRADLFGVHVGKEQTAADYYLAQESEMLGLLGVALGILESAAGKDRG